MEDKTQIFMKELWNLLLSAQTEPSGIPPELIKEKLDEKHRKMEQYEQAKKQLERIKGFAGLPVSEEKPHKPTLKEELKAQQTDKTKGDEKKKSRSKEKRKESRRKRSRSREKRRRSPSEESREKKRRKKDKKRSKKKHRKRSVSSDRSSSLSGDEQVKQNE